MFNLKKNLINSINKSLLGVRNGDLNNRYISDSVGYQFEYPAYRIYILPGTKTGYPLAGFWPMNARSKPSHNPAKSMTEHSLIDAWTELIILK